MNFVTLSKHGGYSEWQDEIFEILVVIVWC